MPNFFYFDRTGNKQGPVSAEQLKELATQGVIDANTPMETDTGHKGLAGQIPGLFATPPPVPQPAVPAPVHQAMPQSAIAPVAGKSKSSMWITLVGILVIACVGYAGWKTITSSSPMDESYKLTELQTMDADEYIEKYGNAAIIHYMREAPYASVGVISGDMVKYLVSQGAYVNAKDGRGNTPLHVVARSGSQRDFAITKFLVSKGADVNAKNNMGDTPLYNAVLYGGEEEIKFLVSQGADVNEKTSGGETMTDFARRLYNEDRANTKKREIAEYLASQRAKGR